LRGICHALLNEGSLVHTYVTSSTGTYWNWLPDSLSNFWGYVNPEAQALGNEVITMAVDSPERHAKLRRFQEIINEGVGSIPLLTEFDNVAMREHVQGYVS